MKTKNLIKFKKLTFWRKARVPWTQLLDKLDNSVKIGRWDDNLYRRVSKLADNFNTNPIGNLNKKYRQLDLDRSLVCPLSQQALNLAIQFATSLDGRDSYLTRSLLNKINSLTEDQLYLPEVYQQ